MVHSGVVIPRSSIASAVLGIAALTLVGAIAQRVAANEDTSPANFTPVVITSSATSKPAPTTKLTDKPEVPKTSVTGTQIKPTPRDISDDSGDDHGGTTSTGSTSTGSTSGGSTSGGSTSTGSTSGGPTSSGVDEGSDSGDSDSGGGGSDDSNDATDHN